MKRSGTALDGMSPSTARSTLRHSRHDGGDGSRFLAPRGGLMARQEAPDALANVVLSTEMHMRGKRGSRVGTRSQGATRGFFFGLSSLKTARIWATMTHGRTLAGLLRLDVPVTGCEAPETNRHWRPSIKSRSQLRCYRDRTEQVGQSGVVDAALPCWWHAIWSWACGGGFAWKGQVSALQGL